MAWTDTTRKAKGTAGAAASVNVTLNSTVAGNMVVAGSSHWQAVATDRTVTVTDGGNTWTRDINVNNGSSNNVVASLSRSILGTGGNRTINAAADAGTGDWSIFVHEFQNPHATPASGTPSTGTGNSTTADTGAMTPADNDVLVVAIVSDGSSGTMTENVSPGDSGFTLSNEDEASFNSQNGSLIFKIIAGAPGTPRAAWTVPSDIWACGIASYKPAAAGLTPTRGRVSWAELEVPFVPTRGRVSFAELEVPFVPTRGRVSWAELEVPTVPTRGRVSQAEFEVPFVGTRGRVSWVEFQVPDVGAGPAPVRWWRRINVGKLGMGL